jgi:hypothetical protein
LEKFAQLLATTTFAQLLPTEECNVGDQRRGLDMESRMFHLILNPLAVSAMVRATHAQ